MAERDLRRALLDDLEQIEDNAELYHSGRNSAYQAVAIQLRNILLKGERSLLKRVVPEPTFHRFADPPEDLLNPSERGGEVAFLFYARGGLLLGGPQGASLQLEFTDALLPLHAWLDQWIINPRVTLRRLISDTADEEVAHTERLVGRTIGHATEVRLLGAAVAGRQMHTLAIVAIGEYVASRVRQLLDT